MSNIACTMDPYRRGTSFNDWYTRLKYFFKVNKIKDEDRMAYFVTLSGPVMFDEIKLLYPVGNFEEAEFDDLIAKLKNRLDKIDPDLVQRYKFSTRVQNPDETTEDFILSLKLQAEFCAFANFKEVAILDRMIAGLRDKNLRQRLLSEEKLSLANAEKIIATWEIARANSGTAEVHQNGGLNRVEAIDSGSGRQYGSAYGKFSRTLELASKHQGEEVNREAGNSRGPVKSRLGIKPYDRGQQWRGQRSYGQRTDRFWKGEENSERQRPDYSQLVCNFCGKNRHIKKKCFKLKNMERDAVNLVDSYRPGPSADRHIAELLERMKTNDSEEEDSDSGDF